MSRHLLPLCAWRPTPPPAVLKATVCPLCAHPRYKICIYFMFRIRATELALTSAAHTQRAARAGRRACTAQLLEQHRNTTTVIGTTNN